MVAWAPVGWLEQVIEARHYAEAFWRVKAATKQSDVPSSFYVDLVRAIEMDLANEAYRAKRKREAGRE